MALVFLGKFRELRAALESALSLETESNPLMLGAMGWILGLTGQHEQARAVLAALQDHARFPRTSA